MYQYNPHVTYYPEHGTYLQQMNVNDIIQQKIVVDQKGGFFKVEFPNIFTEYTFENVIPLQKRVDEWNSNPFKFWQTQLDFAVFCATSSVGISVDHLNSSIPMIRSIYRFHVYYQIRKILKQLRVPLPYESNFSKYNNFYDLGQYHKIFADYKISTDHEVFSDQRIWITSYFGGSYQPISGPRDVKLDKNSWSRWIIPKSEGLTQVGIQKVSESVRAYAYLISVCSS